MNISGYVEHIVYRNEENGYTVLNMVCEEEEITCVGIFDMIHEGECIEAEGEYSIHPTYGQQFKMSRFQAKVPEDELSIERYLDRKSVV